MHSAHPPRWSGPARWPRWLWVVLLAALAATALSQPSPTADTGPPNLAIVVAIKGPIGPATSHYFLRALEVASDRNAHLLITEIDTPGGLDASMRDMIQGILASPVPVVTYVSPSGSRAASAGTYLLYASHVAAMAPATNLGAATPVNLMGGEQPATPASPPNGQRPTEPDTSTPPGTAMERKVVNDAVAYIRGLAELRGRNADWAEAAVRSGVSLAAADALAQDVVDLIATDLPDLLAQLDGREVRTGTATVSLATAGLVLERIDTDWRTNLLGVLTNPNIAYVLMLVGIYGLLLEGYNPGAIVPGVVGAISLLLALFAFQVLSVNYAGLALMLLGLLLIVGEAFVPSFGALGLGGIVSFVIGSIMLLDNDIPGFQISRTLIGSIAFVGGAAMLGIASYYVRSRRKPVVTGAEQLLTEPAYALNDFDGEGMVRIRGELWSATTRTPVKAGQRLRIVQVDGLRLAVEPSTDPPADH